MIKQSKQKVNHNAKLPDSSLPGWDGAIEYAKAELGNAKLRVAQLKAAVKMLKENKLSGLPWPEWAEKNAPKQ